MALTQPAERETTMCALRAGMLFDGNAAAGPGVVVVDGTRIAAVLSPGDGLPDGVEVTDLGDQVTLIPGLIDPHVHLVFDASATVLDALMRTSDDELLAQMRERALSALTAGVTMMRDLRPSLPVTTAAGRAREPSRSRAPAALRRAPDHHAEGPLLVPRWRGS